MTNNAERRLCDPPPHAAPTHHDVLVSTTRELVARTRSALTYCHLEAERTPEALFEALLDSLESLSAGLHVLEKMAAMSTEAGA